MPCPRYSRRPILSSRPFCYAVTYIDFTYSVNTEHTATISNLDIHILGQLKRRKNNFTFTYPIPNALSLLCIDSSDFALSAPLTFLI